MKNDQKKVGYFFVKYSIKILFIYIKVSLFRITQAKIRKKNLKVAFQYEP